MEQNQAQVCEISFNRFRELTYHKRVYFYFRKYADEAIKEFQADKFYPKKFPFGGILQSRHPQARFVLERWQKLSSARQFWKPSS